MDGDRTVRPVRNLDSFGRALHRVNPRQDGSQPHYRNPGSWPFLSG